MGESFVLLVEDNPDEAELALCALKRINAPVRIVVAEDGATAVEMISAGAEPDLVLLDLSLPKLSGFEVLRCIRQNAKTLFTPVLIMSNSRETRDVTESYRLGANGYVAKPVGFEQFLKTINAITGFWLGVNEPAPRR